MDYEFTHTMSGVKVHCSMGFEALAAWATTELRIEPKEKIKEILSHVQKSRERFPSSYEWKMLGREMSLYLDTDEVMIRSNMLDMLNALKNMDKDEPIEEEYMPYESESISICGLDDFEKFLLAYNDFIHYYN